MAAPLPSPKGRTERPKGMMAHRGVLRDLCWASKRLRHPHLINGETEALGGPLVQASAKVRVRTVGGVS